MAKKSLNEKKTASKKTSKSSSKKGILKIFKKSSKDSKKDILQIEDDSDLSKDEDNTSSKSSSSESFFSLQADTTFFYTNDKFIASFEDNEIVKYIQKKYLQFNVEQLNDTVMRKTIIEILNDVKFMTELLDRYGMNIYDFFKFLFRYDMNIFKGLFFKRLKKALKYKKYAVEVKKQSYIIKKKASKKRARLKKTSKKRC